MILVLMLILTASSADGLGAYGSNAYGLDSLDPVGIDIIGSEANNTTILSPNGGPVNLEIVGSTATNILIGYPEDKAKDECVCDACGRPKCYKTVWDDFTRPLCYPWSSYIPTRYNKLYYNRNSGCTCDSGHKVLALGQGSMKS